MPRDAQLEGAIAQLRSYGAVAVLGAGLSAARYPMVAELRTLLWHALDSNPALATRHAARGVLQPDLRLAHPQMSPATWRDPVVAGKPAATPPAAWAPPRWAHAQDQPLRGQIYIDDEQITDAEQTAE